MVCDALVAGCWRSGAGQQAMRSGRWMLLDGVEEHPSFIFMVLTLRLCAGYVCQNKQPLVPCAVLRAWICTTEVESVYCAVRTEPLYKRDTVRL